MTNRTCAFCLAALSITALGFAALPAVAQEAAGNSADTTSTDQLNKPINLDVKSANLFYALSLLFDQLKVGNYTLPEQLKQQEVSAHFTNLPLRTALETLLKNSGYTYKVEAGVYSVVPKIETGRETPVEGPELPSGPILKSKRIYKLASGQIITNAIDLTTRIGGKVLPGPSGMPSSGGLGNGFGGGSLVGGVGSFGSGTGNGIGGGSLVGGVGSFGSGMGSGAGAGPGSSGGPIGGGGGRRGPGSGF